MESLNIKRALISVSDKNGIVPFAKFLHSKGVEIISTGGTAKKLKESDVPITAIESVTGNPEAFAGRMKTISFQVASSLLFRRDDKSDLKEAEELKIKAIDLVVCNLYPFAEALKSGADEAGLVEQVDIGGPTMIRASAKNFQGVAICSNPNQYAAVMDELEQNSNSLSLSTRKKLSAQAFALTAKYDAMISEEFSNRFLEESNSSIMLESGKILRYGENPHQEATLYTCDSLGGVKGQSVCSANILQGKTLSYNNIVDADAAHRAASDALHATDKQACAVSVVKHANPCGLAVANSPLEALELAWAGDPVSAFGGILCFTQEIDLACAEWLSNKFIEVLIAPSISADALQVFAKKQKLRILLCDPKNERSNEKMLKAVSGAILIADEDEGLDSEINSVTKEVFPSELHPLAHFGIMAGKHLRSNAIALVRKIDQNYQLVGAGMGQPNRIDSLKMLAGPRAKEKCSLEDLVLISDAFFPFPDIIEEAAKMGIRAIIQPGGSIRDKEVVAACDENKIAMAFTGRRHFRH